MLINLLAHRTRPLPPAQRRWGRELTAGAMLGLLLGLLGLMWEEQGAQTRAVQAQIQRSAYAALLKQQTALTQEVTELSARSQQIQNLQGMSTQALAALQLWVPALPPGVVVQSLRQEPGQGSSSTASLVLQGVAPPDDSVAHWLQQLPAPLHGELLELRSATWAQGAGRMPVQHFTVRLQSAGGS